MASVESLRSLQVSLNSAIDNYASVVGGSATPGRLERQQAGRAVAECAKEISNSLRDPLTELGQLGLLPTQNLVVRIAIDLDLFNRIQERTTLDQLVHATKADRTLLLRVLRLLVAMRYLLEPQPQVYNATPASKALLFPPVRDWIKTCFDTLEPIWLQTPMWLAQNGYKDVNDLKNNPTLQLYGANFFEELAADPRREADFASAMKIQELAPPAAQPQFPFPESVEAYVAESQSGGSDVMIVDVGGGQGQYLGSLIKEHPTLPGRKVLQDLPTVVAELEGKSLPFEVTAHDFFKPQPVAGARFYHLRGIMHDWPDDSCVEILTRLRTAFKPEYSRLLIQSWILPERDCPAREAMLDINMWTCCGMERTPTQWQALLQRAGFEILRIVHAETGPFGMIEANVVGRSVKTNL